VNQGERAGKNTI